MPRIPESDIQRVKDQIDLAALIRSRGVELSRHGSLDLIGRCPFHEDVDHPNFIVSPHKGLFHCMACGAAGNVIQFVQRFDGISFRHAYELLASGGPAAFQHHRGQLKQNTIPKLPCPLDVRNDDDTLLGQVANYYHSRLKQTPAALDYLETRGLDDEELLQFWQIGFADRTLGLRLQNKNRKEGALIRGRLQELGIFRKSSGHEHFNGSIVIPVSTPEGWVSEMYGRKITEGLRKGTPKHLYLPGPHRGIFNDACLSQGEIILCESLIDALTFLRHGMEAVTTIYGTEGFTEELYEGFKVAKTESVRLAYDADEAGDRAAQRDVARLQGLGIECHRIQFPRGEDANSYALKGGGEALRRAVRKAQWLGAGSVSIATSVPSSLAAELAAKLVAKTPRDGGVLDEGEAEARRVSPAGGPGESTTEEAAKKKSEPRSLAGAERDSPQDNLQGEPTVGQLGGQQGLAAPKPTPAAPELVVQGDHHQLQLGEPEAGGRVYRLGGLMNNGGLEALKITLRLWHDGRFHLDQLDLCKDLDRRRFCEQAARECRLEPDLIKRDLGKLLLACERAQEARLHAETEPGEPVAVSIPPEQKAEAEALLQAPDLIERLEKSFEQAGIVGEKTNCLAAYLTATSRLLPKPLAVIIQSTSAAGKTTLMEAVLSFFPPEQRVKYSAMTGQSLYYLGEKNLQHKILAIVEEEGAEKASYALKLLQSEQELRIASTGKDPHTGRMKTEEYHVEGPVAIVLTTTSIDLDEELMNRCLILTVDESKEQTERIHAIQRKARTLEGLRLKKKRQRVLTLLQNAQRFLRPVEVVNPYADELTFTAERTRTRRDHEKYLTLIEAVTLLHQHQRPLEEDALAGPHIKTTLEDIAVANRLAPEVLGRSLDELPPQTRRLLEEIKRLVAEACEAHEIDQDKCHFTRRDVRERTGASETQVRLHLRRLEDFEYLARRHGRNGISCVYELLIDCRKPQGVAHVGLLDVEELRKKAGV